jgi:hypothetical protein
MTGMVGENILLQCAPICFNTPASIGITSQTVCLESPTAAPSHHIQLFPHD